MLQHQSADGCRALYSGTYIQTWASAGYVKLFTTSQVQTKTNAKKKKKYHTGFTEVGDGLFLALLSHHYSQKSSALATLTENRIMGSGTC